MTDDSQKLIIFHDVSKFYGEILGVNRVNLEIAAGITSLVGPNGAGKSTLMNLMTGLLRPTRGTVTVLGIPPDKPELLFRKVGYCTQFDSFGEWIREEACSRIDGTGAGTRQPAGSCGSQGGSLQQRYATKNSPGAI